MSRHPEGSKEHDRYKTLLQEVMTLGSVVFNENENYAKVFETDNWVQRLSTNDGNRLGIFKRKEDIRKLPNTLDGLAAQIVASQSMGGSMSENATLWGSGITLSISPFSTTEASTLSLMLAVANDSTGRNTAGSTYTGDDVVLQVIIANFILDKVTGSNVMEFNARPSDKNKLRDLILVTDLVSLKAVGLAAMYPRGYPVWHPCTNPDCTHSIEAKRDENGTYLADSKLNFNLVCNSRYEMLTEEDMVYWSKKVVTEEEVRAYQNRRFDIFNSTSNNFQLFKKFSNESFNIENWVKFKIPTLTEYFQEANLWCNSIMQYISTVVEQNRSVNLSEGQFKQFKVNRARKYAMEIFLGKFTPYISFIEIRDLDDPSNPKVINNRESILKVLSENYSSDEEATPKLIALVKAFKEDYTMTWAGVPNFPCPVCEHGQSDNVEEANKLIPLNLTGFFYNLMFWRFDS
jgi:hypothetical protein